MIFYYANLSPAVGSEIDKRRPVLNDSPVKTSILLRVLQSLLCLVFKLFLTSNSGQVMTGVEIAKNARLETLVLDQTRI